MSSPRLEGLLFRRGFRRLRPRGAGPIMEVPSQQPQRGAQPMRDPDFINFEPSTQLTRRDFVMTTLASGFAAGGHPVSAQTQITTDTQGLEVSEVKIPVKDGQMPAYCAKPANKKNLPVVLVVQEIFGVHEHIKDVARRFAKAGYLAVAPELYARQGDVSKLTSMDDIRPIVAKVPDAQVMSDLDAAAEWAAKNGGGAKKTGRNPGCSGRGPVWRSPPPT